MDEREDKRYNLIGIVGSLLFHAGILLFLFFTVMKAEVIEEEGLLVDFGTTNTGQGLYEPAPRPSAPEPEVPQPPTTEPTPAPPADGETKDTQDFEEAAALREAQRKAEEAERERQKLLAEERAKQKALEEEAARKAEEERKRQEELDRQRREAEAEAARRKAEQTARAQSAIAKGFSGKGTGTSGSQGNTGGAGNQGSLTGGNGGGNIGSGTGNSWSLAGRTIVGTLPKPAYNVQESGNVTVEIRVNKDGKVIAATVVSKGTNIQDLRLWNAAREAALKAKFSADPNAAVEQKGTITYRFKLQ